MSIKYFECVSTKRNKFDNLHFNISTYCVLAFYFGELDNYYSNNFVKVRFELYKDIKNKNQVAQTPMKDISHDERMARIKAGDHRYHNYIDDITKTLLIHRRFDFENWFKQDKINKKRLIGEEVHNAMLYLADNYNWDKQALNNVYQSYIEANYETNWIPKKFKAKSSPNRKYKAAIYVEYDIDEFRVYNIFYKKTGEEIDKKLIHIIDFNIVEFDFIDMIFDILKGKTKWEKDEFVLYDKSGKELGRTKI